jgi:TolB-like protein/Flp pilus assembly protein TadD
MLTGELPFTGPTAQAILTKRFLSPVPHVKAVRDVPPPVDEAVTRSLAKVAADRFATAAQFAEALRPAETPHRTPPEQKSARPQQSVAVLPLANMSADPENEYFSDGMTEEIIGALSKVPGLQVASRTSCFAFKGKEVEIAQVGEKLGVGSVLTGSVRKIGNRIRISAQLVNVDSGHNLWSETYDRQLEDVFAIQDEISRAIAEGLKLRLGGTGDQLVAPTKNLEAYNIYLKGRFFFYRFTEAGLRKSLELFQNVLLQEPGYARAYSGIADCWCELADDWAAPDEAYPKAKTAATTALRLEPDLVEAMTSLGKVHCWYEWDFAGAERQLRRAVGLNPNYTEAHWTFGSALPAVGLLGEAISEVRKAITLDPLHPHHSRWLGRLLLYAKDYSGCILQGHKTIELHAEYFHAYLDIGSAYLAQGRAEEALNWYRRSQSLEASVRSYDAFIVRALAPLGRMEEAEAILNRLEEESKQHYVRSEILAMGYAAVGDRDHAFQCLEKAFQARSAGLIYLHLDPGYEPLHDDPRFTDLKQRIGLK